MALRSVLAESGTDPESLPICHRLRRKKPFGDRYNRGGGNLGQGCLREAAACVNSTGADVKAFCCAPVHAMVVGGSLVAANVFPQLAVVGGCSLAKLGMKYRGHLAKEIPVMEDVLVGFALLDGS